MSAEEHGGGGNKFTFLFILAGAMLAAVAFKAAHTGIPLTTLIQQKMQGASTVSAPAVTETKTANTPTAKKPTAKKKVAPPQEHWTTITLDADGHVISVLHY